MWGPLGGATGAKAYSQNFDRAQQVNELLVAQPLCRATNPDRSLLEVGVKLQDGTLTCMRINLPPGFPADRPALSITSVRHPWVDAVGRMSFPLLDRWGSPGIRLASVVAEAFKGLGGQPALPPPKQAGAAAAAGSQQQQQQQAGAAPLPAPHPPPVAQHSAAHLGGAGSGPASMSPAGSGSSAAGGAAQPPRGGRPASIPATFSEVAHMSEEELRRTLADDAAYRRLVDRIAASMNLWQVADQLRGQTRELAAANLARGEEQADIRNQMAIIRSSEYAPAKAAFDAKWARQQAVLGKLSPEVLMRRLQEAARQAEEDGERLLAALGSGELGVEAFVERYTRAQATFHQRDLKLQAAQQTLLPLGR